MSDRTETIRAACLDYVALLERLRDVAWDDAATVEQRRIFAILVRELDGIDDLDDASPNSETQAAGVMEAIDDFDAEGRDIAPIIAQAIEPGFTGLDMRRIRD